MTPPPEGTRTSSPPPTKVVARGGDLEVLALNLVHKAVLRRVLELFEDAGIECFVLKGVPLTLELYGSLADRPMVDVDVVVPSARAAQAHHLLRKNNFTDFPGCDFERSQQFNYQHPMVAHTGSRNSTLELHWHSFSPALFDVPEALLFSELRTVAFDGESYRVMSCELALCHLAAHALQHELCKPSTLLDIARAWEHWHVEIDLLRLETLARLTGTFHGLVFLLSCCHDNGMSRTPPPQNWHSTRAALVKQLLPAGRITLRPTSNAPRALLRLALLELPAALDAIGAELLPHPKKLEQVHGPLGTVALWHVYLTRPFGIFRRSPRLPP